VLEYPVPALRHLALHEAEDVLARRGLALLQHDHQQRPLVLFRMRGADGGGFRHLAMRARCPPRHNFGTVPNAIIISKFRISNGLPAG